MSLDEFFGPRRKPGDPEVVKIETPKTTGASIEELASNLPVYGVDSVPHAVSMSAESAEMAEHDKKFFAQFLDPKNDTEQRVKYVLSSLFGMKLKKDGDYVTIAGGRQVWRKKVSDYVGYTPAKKHNWLTYVEVKAVSPGNNFNLSRLDRTGNPDGITQHERLSKVSNDGNLVLLAIGWWFPRHESVPTLVSRDGIQRVYWPKKDVYLEIDLIMWPDWLELLSGLDRRSIRPKDRESYMHDCKIMQGPHGRWFINDAHWWHDLAGAAISWPA